MAGRGVGLTLPAWMTNTNNTTPSTTTNAAQTQPSPSPSPSPTPTTTGTSAGWTEHTAPDGRKYYYNSVTKVSKWTKPDEMKTEAEKAVAAVQTVWKEYVSEKGRKYYYNTLTKESRWDMPDELKQSQSQSTPVVPTTPPPASNLPTTASVAAIPNTTSHQTNATQSVSQSDENSSVDSGHTPQRQFLYTTKREAVNAFKDMLTAFGVTASSTWEAVVRATSMDMRFKALKTDRERKQALSEYVTEYRRSEKEAKRIKENAAKDAFRELLRSTAGLDPSCTYKKSVPLWEKDVRFSAVEFDEDRFEIFENYMDELDEKQQEQQRNERRALMSTLNDVLSRHEHITVNITWARAQELLAGNSAFEAVDLLDRLTVFDSHMRRLEREFHEQQTQIADAQRRQARKNREAFKKLLNECVDNNTLTARTSWLSFVEHIKEDARMVAMMGQTGSTPRDLFEDVREVLRSKFHSDKKLVKELIKNEGISITAETGEDEITGLLNKHRHHLELPSHLSILLKEIVDKSAKKRKRDRKRNEENEDSKAEEHSEQASTAAMDTLSDEKHKNAKKDELEEGEAHDSDGEVELEEGEESSRERVKGNEEGERSGDEVTGKRRDKERKKERHHHREKERSRERKSDRRGDGSASDDSSGHAKHKRRSKSKRSSTSRKHSDDSDSDDHKKSKRSKRKSEKDKGSDSDEKGRKKEKRRRSRDRSVSP